MPITWANRLEGTTGTAPTTATLAATGDPADALNDNQLSYDNTHLLRGRTPIRFRTWYSGPVSGNIGVPIPPAPWSIRFYVRTTQWTDPIVLEEYRTLLVLGDRAIVMRSSAAGNALLRLAVPGNLSVQPTGTDQGSPVALGQDLRVEISYDGAGTLTGRIFAGDATTGERFTVWSYTPTATVMQLTGYRWQRYQLLVLGDTDATTGGEVSAYQNRLLEWDSTILPTFGADGDYGNETRDATITFQNTYSLTADGEAGPETRSALDLAIRQDADPDDFPVPVWIGAVAVMDEDRVIGPLDPMTRSTSPLTAQTAVSGRATDTTAPQAHALAQVALTVKVSSQRRVSPALTVTATSHATPRKHTTLATQPLSVFAETHPTVSTVVTSPPPPPEPPLWGLRVYEPAGEMRGDLPFPLAWDCSMLHNGVGAMSLAYATDAPGFDKLTFPFEIAVRLNRGGDTTFVEPVNCRFICLRQEIDFVDRTKVMRYSLASYPWMLRKIKIPFPDAVEPDPVKEEHTFGNFRPAGILRTVIDDAKSRNALTEMDTAFSNSVDATGTDWDDDPIEEITYPTGTDALNILETFAEEGWYDWNFSARSLRLYRPGVELNRSLDDEVHLPGYSGALEAIAERSLDEYAFQVLARSDTAARVAFSGSIPPKLWGLWEEFVSVQGGSGYEFVSRTAHARSEYTSDLNRFQHTRRFPVTAYQPIPLLDYRPGDWVNLYRGDQTLTGNAERVQQITLSFGSDRVLYSTVLLGTRYEPRELRLVRRLDRLTNRGIIGGTGVRRDWGS